MPFDSFAEIDPANFFPGSTQPASTVEQINQNILEATLRPEFFGPTAYVHGDTVALPTSTFDSYAYSRAECQYLWWWENTGTESQIRMPLFAAVIDPASGVVTIVIDRLPPGGPPTATHDGNIAVVTIASRAAEHPAIDTTGSSHNPPADVATHVVDNTYDVWWSLPGKPPANTTFQIGSFPHPVRFSGGFLLAKGTSLIAPTADQVFKLYRLAGGIGAPVQVGSVSYPTAGAGIASFDSGVGGPFVDFDTHDVMTVLTPVVQDATLSDCAFTLVGRG